MRNVLALILFVMLTAPNGEVVYVKREAVVAIVPYHDKPLYGTPPAITEIELQSGKSLYVIETSEQAAQKLN